MKSLPKFLFLASLLLIQFSIYAQDKTQQVEKNLVGAVQLSTEKPWTIQERMAHYKIPGLSIAVVQNYKIVMAKGYGWADDSLKVPVTTQTLFQAASISKSLNAVGVLKLVQNKKLDVYADINTFLSSWKFPYDSLSKGKKISVANLLSHTAGLTVHGFEGYVPGAPLPTVLQILNGEKPANSDAVRSMYEPGIKSAYSGGGTTITQLIVTDITRQPYAEYMKKEVLQPMGMTASTFAQPPAGVKQLSTGYNAAGKRIEGNYHVYPEQAPAGLWTNPTDLAKYIIESQLAYEGKSSKVLNQATTKLRLTPYLDKSAALGVFIDNLDSVLYFQHGGANEGFRCQYYGSLKDGNGLVVMVNSDNGAIIPEVVNSIAKVYEFKGLYHSTVKEAVSVPDSILESYIGQYELGPNFIITVSKEGNTLYAQATGQGSFEIIAETPTKFFPRVFKAYVDFTKDDTGKVNALILTQNGRRTEAKKIK